MSRGGFPPVYRMPKCKKCVFHCRPCLTIDEAEVILADSKRRTFNGDALCQECRLKSNRSQNKWTYKRAGREFDNDEVETEVQELETKLKQLQDKLDLLQPFIMDCME